MYTPYDRPLTVKYSDVYSASSPLSWLVACNEDYAMFLAPCRAPRVLDLGCGVGSYANRHVLRGAELVVGVDVSSAQIDSCGSCYKNVAFINVDVRDFSRAVFNDHHHRYDLVNASFLYDAAESEGDLLSMIKTVAKCLRVGGVHTALFINPGIHRSLPFEWLEFGLAMLEDWAPSRAPRDGEEVFGRFAMSRQDLVDDSRAGVVLRGRCFHVSTYARLFADVGLGNIEVHHPVEWPVKLFCKSRKIREKFCRYVRCNPEMMAIRAIRIR